MYYVVWDFVWTKIRFGTKLHIDLSWTVSLITEKCMGGKKSSVCNVCLCGSVCRLTDLCLRQCLSCDMTPPPQVRVQAVHLAHSPHQYVVTSSSSSRLLEATPSSYTQKDTHTAVVQLAVELNHVNSIKTFWRSSCLYLNPPRFPDKPNLFSLLSEPNVTFTILFISFSMAVHFQLQFYMMGVIKCRVILLDLQYGAAVSDGPLLTHIT